MNSRSLRELEITNFSAAKIDSLADGFSCLPATSIEQLSVQVLVEDLETLESFEPEWKRIDDTLADTQFARVQLFELMFQMSDPDKETRDIVAFDIPKMLPKLSKRGVLHGWFSYRNHFR